MGSQINTCPCDQDKHQDRDCNVVSLNVPNNFSDLLSLPNEALIKMSLYLKHVKCHKNNEVSMKHHHCGIILCGLTTIFVKQNRYLCNVMRVCGVRQLCFHTIWSDQLACNCLISHATQPKFNLKLLMSKMIQYCKKLTYLSQPTLVYT